MLLRLHGTQLRSIIIISVSLYRHHIVRHSIFVVAFVIFSIFFLTRSYRLWYTHNSLVLFGMYDAMCCFSVHYFHVRCCYYVYKVICIFTWYEIMKKTETRYFAKCTQKRESLLMKESIKNWKEWSLWTLSKGDCMLYFV